ncbi:MAG: hypothetical protein WDN67_01915 [Candidatus Moraniibacteriota bacterium]
MSKEVAALILGVVAFFGLNSLGQSLVGPVVCEDGWHSPSIGKQGACSHHGGVDDDLQNTVSIASFASGVFSTFYSYGLMDKISERKRKKEEEQAAIRYEEVHKNDPRCPRHPDERMVQRMGRYGEFWGVSPLSEV